MCKGEGKKMELMGWCTAPETNQGCSDFEMVFCKTLCEIDYKITILYIDSDIMLKIMKTQVGIVVNDYTLWYGCHGLYLKYLFAGTNTFWNLHYMFSQTDLNTSCAYQGHQQIYSFTSWHALKRFCCHVNHLLV